MLGETGMLAEDASVCISRNSVGDSEIGVPDNSIWTSSAFNNKLPTLRLLIVLSGSVLSVFDELTG